MGPFVDAGLFMDITDWWDAGDFEGLESVRGAMTMDDRQWGVPYTYYQWGMYYREDIFNELGLSEPATFEEEISNCQAIVDSGRACYSIGTKFLWTAGGWFDYLNMRTNGFDFHMQLALGEIAWTDDRVRETFANWRRLIDMGAFIEDHQTYSWQEALTPMVKGEAAMYVMGNFAVAPLREAGLTDDQLGFFQFPEITAGLPMAEEAPTDTVHIPSNAKNKTDAKRFLIFMARADVQEEVNKILGQLPINSKSSVSDDKFLKAGNQMLNNAYAMAQFYDRDAPAEMASAGMKGFQEYMAKPDRREAILKRLEKVRQRVYK